MRLTSVLAERVDAVFADFDRPRYPGAALMVVDRGERLLSKGYGLGDLESGRPIEADSSCYLASISKQFTAMAVMMLAEQGKLSFDDLLVSYFPQFPAWAREVSLRHMLQHTAGLPNYGEFVPDWDKINLTNQLVLEGAMKQAGLEFPAGTKFEYGGTGYVLLAMIVAMVAGRTFAGFMKDRIFEPLGMKHTLVYDEERPALHKPVQGYIAEDGEILRWDYPLLTTGEGGMFSTLDDLFLWDQALNGERLVSREALQRAFTSGATSDGKAIDYGFGWYTNRFPGGRRHVAHGGTCGAYTGYIIRFLEIGRTIVVLSNLGPIEPVYKPPGLMGPGPRAHKVAQILFDD
jgi:CubicO group peptidase (beta-lactamase class C family)